MKRIRLSICCDFADLGHTPIEVVVFAAGSQVKVSTDCPNLRSNRTCGGSGLLACRYAGDDNLDRIWPDKILPAVDEVARHAVAPSEDVK